ncbi:hypothetical protein CSPX01_06327 [Colletotrichum filicis]|nr:hypothetical protein CSPX01_06327 [Colletotrichum filicis]
MEFDTSVVDEIEIEKNSQVYKRRPAIWSVAFCRNLHHLSLHPVWMGSLDLLAIALQYVSILRTRNYQDWPLDNPTDDNFLATFINVIEKYKGKATLNASPLSTLMLDLEGSIVTDAEPRTNGRKLRTYKISIHEINNIIRALANSTYMGMPQWGGFTPKEYAKLAVYGRRPSTILVRLRWEAKNKKRRARLNVPKTEPFRVPSRHRAAREDETTGDAQLRADLDDAIRQKEALEAELRALPQIEKRRRRTADENAHLEELQAENKELRERLESEASEYAQMEEILKTDLEEAGRQIEAWKARVRAPSPR